jgi:hypothetical protein
MVRNYGLVESILKAVAAQRMDDTIPNEGLVALQMVRDIETVYMFSDDSTTHESYLRHTESGDLAVFEVVGVAVETRLPPITDDKWRRYICGICLCNN